ncbi:tetratricopeptide (TPR) repeat protein [Actinokineospora baliensis]|uniref:tetratricopeptide repeat protein n=1 Tax=Actinokineospora baliensis TaxID=547056 RepID=UPI00195DA6CF|nr:tetratricopeptide repeat protein [Actinokineospora baliensis]MBM7770661.1 tetratricopeptide (TPR) repeat protein [Actinokineospora baliensis]
MVLRGVGGVGKTALALFWLAKISASHPDGQLFAELTLPTGKPVPAEDVLGRFLRALGVAKEAIPTSLAERTTLYRSLTAKARLAVLLDNVASAAQAKVLIPASPGSVVVATSRRQLLGLVATGAVPVRVDPLPKAGGLRLLASYTGQARVDAEPENAALLTRMCGGLPLALCVVAALVTARPRRSLGWLVERLRDEHRRLDVLSVEEDYSVRATFDLAYEDLADESKTAYRAIGLSPGALVVPELLATGLSADVEDAAEALESLVDAGLVEEFDEGWYRAHSLVHVHAKALATQHNGDATAVLRRIVDWYVATIREVSHTLMPARPVQPWSSEVSVELPPRLAGAAEALDWLERVHGDVVQVIRTSLDQGWHEPAYLLAHALQPLFVLNKQFMAAIEVCELGKRAAAVSDQPGREASMRKHLARLFIEIGQYESAEREIRATLADAVERQIPAQVASAHKSLGLLHQTRGAHDVAVADFRTALELLPGTARPWTRALLLLSLGTNEVDAGNAQDATEHIEAAREIFREQPDEYNIARADRELGRARLALGSPAEAENLMRKALAVFERHKAHHEVARTHRALADWARHGGDQVVAQRHVDRAAEILGGPGLAPS